MNELNISQLGFIKGANSFSGSLSAPAGTLAFKQQAEDLLDLRLTEVPIQKATSYYFGALGGNTGSGTIGSPYLPVDGNAMITQLNSIMGSRVGNVTFYLKDDVKYRCTGGITINQNDVSISRWTDGAEGAQPEVTTFQATTFYGVGAFASVGSGVWVKDTFDATVANITWIRLVTATTAGLRAGTEVPFIKCTTLEQCTLLTSSFFIDVPGEQIYVHLADGSDPTGDLEMCQGTSYAGITVSNVDGGRISNVAVTGFAIQTADNGICGIVNDVGGSQKCVVDECSIFYSGSAHVLVGLSSASAISGGYTTWYNNYVGLTKYNAGAFLMTPYKSGGGQQAIRWGNTAPYGVLPEMSSLALTTCTWTAATRTLTKTGGFTGVTFDNLKGNFIYLTGGTGHTPGLYQIRSRTDNNNIVLVAAAGLSGSDNADTATGGFRHALRRGSIDYIHTSGGSNYIGLNLNWGSTSKNTTWGCGQPSSNPIEAQPVTTNQLDRTAYRSWIVNEVCEGGAGSTMGGMFGKSYTINLNRNIKARPYAQVVTDPLLYSVGGTFRDIHINGSYELNTNDVHTTGTARAVQAGVGSSNPSTFINCAFYIVGNSSISFRWSDGVATWIGLNMRWFDCIYSISAAVDGSNGQNLAPNQAAGLELTDDPTGGMQRCAFFDMGTTFRATNNGSPPASGEWGVDNAACLPIDLTAVATVGYVPQVADQYYQAGSTNSQLPISIDHDINFTPRPTGAHDIGPVTHAA